MIKGPHRFCAAITLLPVLAVADSPPDLFSYSLEQLMELEITDVVTHVEKRESLAQKVPFSLAVLEPVNLYSPLLDSLQMVDQRVSGLVITEYNKVTPQLYIRGVGSNVSGAGDDPSVAYLVDGVSIARPGLQNQQLFDVQQIEVMKGPQGTLYGKGVIGGAVNVVYRKPELADYNSLSTAVNQRGWALQNINNQQVGHHSANRFSLSYREQQGYLENVVTGSEQGEFEELIAREQWHWQGSDQALGLLLEYSRYRGLDPARTYQGETPLPAFGGSALVPYANNERRVAIAGDGTTERDTYSLMVTYQLEQDYGTWESRTAYVSGDYEFQLPVLPILFPESTNGAHEKSWQLSQELRLQQSWQDWQWQSGVYLSQEQTSRDELGDLTGLMQLLGAGALLTDETPGTTRYDAVSEVSNWALFIQSRWNFAVDWSLHLGLRGDYVKKDFDLSVTGGDPLDVGLINSEDFGVETGDHWRELSYALSLEYQLNPQVMLYGRLATGFKSGSFNMLAISPDSALASAEPETALNTELGWKGYFFDQRLQVNGALFQLDYDELQVYAGLESGANAPRARIQGAELDVRFKPLQGLELAGNYTYLDSEYLRFSSPGSGQTLTGNRLPRAPTHELALSLNYSWEDTGQNRYRLEWQGNYTGAYSIVPQDADGDSVPSRQISNLALYARPRGSAAVLSLWVRNLFDEQYPLHVFGQGVFGYTENGSAWNLAEPRTLGMGMTWTF
ncbi:TonB-dependent receptor [Ketobacter sp.]|uniref:TonB-dependent receptor n=1 Tax=Ketobacter sp. TaxID=2083498 RepID=UPI000F1701CA|nr:TonB-dependent receptor [Ketobacter sp.]RLU01995.1 MAG: TonB-dependent receptor [Ketobacter sp.]